MATATLSALSGAGGGAYAQLQEMQAQRMAEQAEGRARALRSAAEEAQANAVRARETARTRRVESDRAEGTAQDARANLVSLKSGQDTQADLTTLRDGIARVQEALNTTSTAAAVINAEGQTTGTLVNVTA